MEVHDSILMRAFDKHPENPLNLMVLKFISINIMTLKTVVHTGR